MTHPTFDQSLAMRDAWAKACAAPTERAPSAENSKPPGASVGADGQGASTLLGKPGFTYVVSWRNAVEAFDVAELAWDWLRATGRKTRPAVSLSRYADEEIYRLAGAAKERGLLLHLVSA